MSGREGFALQDREVDLDLVDPARVGGQVHQGEIVELCLETVDGALAAVNGAAVNDPEDALGRMIGFLGHHLGDERVEGDDGDLAEDVAEETGTVHIPGGDVRTDAMTPVLVLDANGAARRRWRDRVKSAPDRDLRLLVGTDDELALGERAVVPAPVVEVEDASRLGREIRIAREDPTPPALVPKQA